MFFIQLLCKTNLLVGVWWYKVSVWHQYVSYSTYNWKHKSNVWRSRDSSIYWLERRRRHVFCYQVCCKFMGKFSGEHAEPFCPSASQHYVAPYSLYHFEVHKKELQCPFFFFLFKKFQIKLLYYLLYKGRLNVHLSPNTIWCRNITIVFL